jgi:hypothetical protein
MIPDQIPTPELDGFSIVPLPNGEYVVAFVDQDGTVTARRASRNKLTQLFGYIGDALEPGLLAQYLNPQG